MSELVKALVRARLACKATVHKQGDNQHQKYRYVGHEHVLLGGSRECLLAEGLVLEQAKVEFLGTYEYETRNGQNLVLRWRGVHRLVHVSGEERTYEFEATTVGNDKAAYVASTALDRTALLRVLLLAGSAEENPEHDSHEQNHGQRQERQAQRGRPGPAEGQAAAKASPAAAGGVDEFGLRIPAGECPVFHQNDTRQFAGQPWTLTQAGWLIQQWHERPESRALMKEHGVLPWAEYALARRKARHEKEHAAKAAADKAEQEEAERHLAQEGRGL